MNIWMDRNTIWCHVFQEFGFFIFQNFVKWIHPVSSLFIDNCSRTNILYLFRDFCMFRWKRKSFLSGRYRREAQKILNYSNFAILSVRISLTCSTHDTTLDWKLIWNCLPQLHSPDIINSWVGRYNISIMFLSFLVQLMSCP